MIEGLKGGLERYSSLPLVGHLISMGGWKGGHLCPLGMSFVFDGRREKCDLVGPCIDTWVIFEG